MFKAIVILSIFVLSMQCIGVSILDDNKCDFKVNHNNKISSKKMLARTLQSRQSNINLINFHKKLMQNTDKLTNYDHYKNMLININTSKALDDSFKRKYEKIDQMDILEVTDPFIFSKFLNRRHFNPAFISNKLGCSQDEIIRRHNDNSNKLNLIDTIIDNSARLYLKNLEK